MNTYCIQLNAKRLLINISASQQHSKIFLYPNLEQFHGQLENQFSWQFLSDSETALYGSSVGKQILAGPKTVRVTAKVSSFERFCPHWAENRLCNCQGMQFC